MSGWHLSEILLPGSHQFGEHDYTLREGTCHVDDDSLSDREYEDKAIRS